MKIPLFYFVCVLMLCSFTSTQGNAQTIAKPKAPKIVRAILYVDNSVWLEWTYLFEDAFSYVITYKSDNTEFSFRVPHSQDNFYLVRNLSPNTLYVFTVSAENNDGQGLPSNGVQVKTHKNEMYTLTEPKASKIVRAILYVDNSVWLEWTYLFEDAFSYVITYKSGSTEFSFRVPHSQDNFYLVRNLSPNTLYVFTVSAVNNAGQGLPSNWVPVKTHK